MNVPPNLARLVRLWVEKGLRSLAAEVSEINRYAVEGRYPGDWEPIAREEAETAVAVARQVRQTARALLPPEAPG
jgi:hypothetical protein